MILSQTCEIAIRSAAFIAAMQKGRQAVTVRELSVSICENPHTIAKVLQVLVKQGLLSSLKGPAGGFFLTKLQMSKPIINIVKAIDGDAALEKCALGLTLCSEKHPCPLHAEFVKGRKIIIKIFNDTKLANLSTALNKGLVFLS